MQYWRDRLLDQTGATLVLVAASMVAMLGFAALAIDVGFLYNARAEAQRTADAMALAAASAFIDDPENAQTLAASRAADYAGRNPVFGVTADFQPDTDMTIWLADRKVQVVANFTRDRGNPMPTYFAKVLGIADANVRTVATAEAYPADAVGCLTPWALPDKWEDTSESDPTFDFDDDDKSDTPSVGDSFDNYCPCTRTSGGALTVDTSFPDLAFTCSTFGTDANRCTGYGSDIRNTDGGGYVGDVGRTLTLKPGNPQQAWNPGWFMAWRPPGNMGGSDYKENIITCIDEQMFNAGDFVPIDTEPGNMIGPTIQGVEERIGTDPHYWQDGCTDGYTCIMGPGCGDTNGDKEYGTGETECSGFEGRLITVPLMAPSEVMRNGLTEIQFRGFMRLFLDNPDGNDITGHILGLGGAAGNSAADEDAGALPLRLRLVENG
jgi:Flp pilus assembly protein TadG